MSRWSLIWLPLLVLLQIPTLLGRYGEFRNDPSLATGWMFFTWVLCGVFCVVLAVRTFRTAQIVTVHEDEIRFQKALGKRTWPAETVTTVTDDQIAFHLYSKGKEISLSKKRVPSDLAQCLDDRVLAGTGMNKTK